MLLEDLRLLLSRPGGIGPEALAAAAPTLAQAAALAGDYGASDTAVEADGTLTRPAEVAIDVARAARWAALDLPMAQGGAGQPAAIAAAVLAMAAAATAPLAMPAVLTRLVVLQLAGLPFTHALAPWISQLAEGRALATVELGPGTLAARRDAGGQWLVTGRTGPAPLAAQALSVPVALLAVARVAGQERTALVLVLPQMEPPPFAPARSLAGLPCRSLELEEAPALIVLAEDGAARGRALAFTALAWAGLVPIGAATGRGAGLAAAAAGIPAALLQARRAGLMVLTHDLLAGEAFHPALALLGPGLLAAAEALPTGGGLSAPWPALSDAEAGVTWRRLQEGVTLLTRQLADLDHEPFVTLREQLVDAATLVATVSDGVAESAAPRAVGEGVLAAMAVTLLAGAALIRLAVELAAPTGDLATPALAQARERHLRLAEIHALNVLPTLRGLLIPALRGARPLAAFPQALLA